MSDDTEAYHNAWVSAFARLDKKLLCSWHIDCSWCHKVNKLVRDKDQAEEVYAALKTLQTEIEEASFRRSSQQFSGLASKERGESCC